MMQRWKKLGLIFNADQRHSWMYSHASVPLAEHLGGDLYHIYFSSRNHINQSYTGYITVNIRSPLNVLDVSSEPVIAPGELGCFDDSGAMASWITDVDDKRYLYYAGWNLGVTVPFRNAIGLAIADKGEPTKSFKRAFKGPIVDRSASEPHFVGTCCVLYINGEWFMWYLSCTEWRIRDGKPQHRYHIKYATSIDGVNWIREGIVAIPFLNDEEYAISRPSVIYENNLFRMWYSYRGDRYRIGYAESTDGITWERKDVLCGLDTSQGDWDAYMVEYPYVFRHQKNLYMLYNGNGYGQSGFGIAVLED